MTERGIETAEGVREFDIVVWATGFDFGTGALRRMGIRGRDGLALEDYWADGPKTFLGVQTTGFPNFFFPGGPHAAAGNNPRYNGDQVDFVTDTLVYVRDHGYDTIEVDPAAEDAVDEHDRHGRGVLAVRGEQLLLRHQHPRQAAPVPPELGRPAQALQGDRRRPSRTTTRRSNCHDRRERRVVLARARGRERAVRPGRRLVSRLGW